MPFNLKPKWKPVWDEPEVISQVTQLPDEQQAALAAHIQRMRYEEVPYKYQETITCRNSNPGVETHLIRFTGIDAEFLFRLDPKTSLTPDDLESNPELLGVINIISCLLDNDPN